MKSKLITLCTLILLLTPPLIKGQNQISKKGFFKSLALDPVMTLRNASNSPISCININYRIDGGQIQKYKFEGILPALTNVDISLPRINVSTGMHFFDASISAENGSSLKNKTFAEGLSFTLSPGIKIDIQKKQRQSTLNNNLQTKGCSCQNGKGLDENISFWFSVYINDIGKLDAFGSTDKGKTWKQAKWNNNASLENNLNTAVFNDLIYDRNYNLTISTVSVQENLNTNTNESTLPGLIKGFSCKAYPNPFDNKVNIQYEIVKSENIDITLTDISGKIIAQPVKSVKHGIGKYTYNFNASGIPKGIYFCTIKSKYNQQTIKIIKN